MARFIEPKKASNERPRGPEKDASEGVVEDAEGGVTEDVWFIPSFTKGRHACVDRRSVSIHGVGGLF